MPLKNTIIGCPRSSGRWCDTEKDSQQTRTPNDESQSTGIQSPFCFYLNTSTLASDLAIGVVPPQTTCNCEGLAPEYFDQYFSPSRNDSLNVSADFISNASSLSLSLQIRSTSLPALSLQKETEGSIIPLLKSFLIKLYLKAK